MNSVLQSCILLAGIAFVAASPARMFLSHAARNSPLYDTVTTVDCSNKEAVKFVSKTHGNFRCVYPEHQRSRFVSNEDHNPILFNNLPVGLESASLKLDSENGCQLGTMFVPEIGECVDVPKPLSFAPLESESLTIINPPRPDTFVPTGYVPQTESDCKTGEIFNPSTSQCIQNVNPVVPAQPPSLNQVREPEPNKEVVRLDSGTTTEDSTYSTPCIPNVEVHVSELDICVPNPNYNPKLESASLVREEPFPETELLSVGDCAEDEVFVSELGICQYAAKPAVQKPLVSDSLVVDVAPNQPFHESTECKDSNHMYVPELGICVPYSQSTNNNQEPPPSSNLIHEPDTLEITAFGSSKSEHDCKDGQVFVSEIGECL